MEKKTRTSLAANLRYLMDRARLTEKQVEAKSGVAQKTINNAINARVGLSIDNVDKLASCFGLTGWQLISPNLIRDIESGGTITQMVVNYLDSSQEGQQLIYRLAEREAQYKLK